MIDMKPEYENAILVLVILMSVFTACNKPMTSQKVANAVDPTLQLPSLNTVSGNNVKQPSLNDSAINDLNITNTIKSQSLIALGLKSMIINVKTNKGIVTLNGKLDTQDQIMKAESIAGGVAGVKGVKNKLVTQ